MNKLISTAVTLIFGISVSACTGDSGNDNEHLPQTARAIPYAPSADPDAFYQVDQKLLGAPGRLIKSREITYQPLGVPLPNPAWHIQYETIDIDGQPISAVATVVKPLIPNTYGEAVLMSFQHAYDSLGATCTPSYTATGNTANQTNLAETAEFLPGLQALGWTMVIPDYEGSYHAFGAGRLSGRATLDAIRAALSFTPLELTPSTPVGLWGYSGGAYATTWGLAIQPQYAPELNIVGSVAGGTPLDFVEITQIAENTGYFSLLFSSLFGITRSYPEFLPKSALNEKGILAAEALRDSCTGDSTDPSIDISGRLADYTNSSNPYNSAGFAATRPKLNLLNNNEIPSSDIFVYHEVDDELVPISGADNLVDFWCQQGAPITYYRSVEASNAGPAGTHVAGAAVGTPKALAYLSSRFQGLPLPELPLGTTRCN